MCVRHPGHDNSAAAHLCMAFTRSGQGPRRPNPPTSIRRSLEPRAFSAVCSLALRVSTSALVLFSSDSSCWVGGQQGARNTRWEWLLVSLP